MNQKNDITLDFPKPRDAWDALSMKEKAEMIGVAVRNGITNLNDIRDRYNEFAEGGPVDTDWSYNSWKKQIAEHMGIRPDEDNTYDYEAYFKKYPEEAWKMLKGDPDAHFSDEFKTVYHPTFSSKSIGNDGSIYSGVRNSKTNPQGLVGGTWSPDYHTFTMSYDGYRGPVSMDDRKWYLENAENNGVQLREADGSLPIYDGIPWGGVLPNVTIYSSKHSLGGPLVESAMNEYKKGGSIHIAPSKKGTFTAAAKKHGKSVQAFASQVLAHPENYSPAMRKKANFARNSAKWHGLGGNLFDGTSQPTQKMQIGLDVQGWPNYTTEQIIANGERVQQQRKTPEENVFSNFVVKAYEDPMVIMAKESPEYRKSLSKMYDDENFRYNDPRLQTKEAFTKERAKRLLEIYKQAGEPKFKPLPSNEPRAYTKDIPFFKSSRHFNRATMYLNEEPVEGFSDIMAELSHPIQKRFGNNKPWKERLNPFYDVDNYNGKTRYDFPNTYEYETHEDFEPIFWDYITDGVLLGQKFHTGKIEGEQKLGNDNIIYNPSFQQLVDSARVYNRRKQNAHYEHKNPLSDY